METLTEERPVAPGVAAPPTPAARSKLRTLLVAMRPQERSEEHTSELQSP